MVLYLPTVSLTGVVSGLCASNLQPSCLPRHRPRLPQPPLSPLVPTPLPPDIRALPPLCLRNACAPGRSGCAIPAQPGTHPSGRLDPRHCPRDSCEPPRGRTNGWVSRCWQPRPPAKVHCPKYPGQVQRTTRGMQAGHPPSEGTWGEGRSWIGAALRWWRRRGNHHSGRYWPCGCRSPLPMYRCRNGQVQGAKAGFSQHCTWSTSAWNLP